MRICSAPALLLDVLDLQERDRIIDFLTAEHGRKRGVARGARTKYSRFAGRLQPLSKAQVDWVEKEGRDLVRVSSVETLRPAGGLQETLEDLLLGCYLAEHLSVFAQEDEPSGPLFRLLDTTVEALLGGCDRRLAARYFEIWVLRLAGVFPVPDSCPHCRRGLGSSALLLEGDGALVCRDCGIAGAFSIGPEELELLRRSGKEGLESLAARPPAGSALDRVEELCGRVRRAFLQHELKSYRVMNQALAAVPPA